MINVAIIGTGNISPKHIQGYLAFPDRCKIVALVDIYPEKAHNKKKQFHLDDAEVYDSHKPLLERDDIHLVSICTPPYTHAQIAIDFLNAQKDVIVEKPMASSLEECDLMIEAEKKSGRTLSVIAQNRFRTPVMKLKQTLDSGLIGELVHAQVDSFWWRGHCYYDLWWRGTWEKEGGGCTLNHAVHHIDMLSWMTELPNEITAVITNAAHDNAEVEDLSIAIIKYGNGALGQITSSVVHHGEEQQLIFQGRKARISVPWSLFASVSKSNGFPERDTEYEKKIQQYYDDLPELKFEGHTGQIHDVITAIEQKKAPMIQGEDGRRTLEVITAIYKSGCTSLPVKLPLSKGDPFYTSEGIKKNAIYFYQKKTSTENFEDEEITVGSDYQKKE
ncbi:MAG: Gfo/Idh/MocA family oxidoreductase [Clostridiaceae bacterium]|jgi:predicted dehydrogenase|nr:Gfo/Idh/MocA family oxidoreductase [Clostridiaceae bacterium]